MINQFPEDDNAQLKHREMLPGSFTYADLTNKGKQMLILSDSILVRIEMKLLLNRELNSGYIYLDIYKGHELLDPGGGGGGQFGLVLPNFH